MTLDLPRKIEWGLLAGLVGLVIATSPLSMSIVALGIVTAGLLVLIEPALAIVIMLAAAPLKTLIDTELALALPIDTGQLLFITAVGAWGTHKITRRTPFQPINRLPLMLPILLFIGATTLTLPGAYAIGPALTEWLKWIEIAILVYMIADFGRARAPWFAFGLVLAAVIQAIVGMYEFRGGSGAPHLWILEFRYFRAFGTFGQPNPFGAFMGLILPLALGITWGHLTKFWTTDKRWYPHGLLTAIYVVMSGIIALGLLASWSRGAWIGFGTASMVLLWMAPRRLWQGTLVLIGVGGFGSLLWLNGYLPPQVTERITDFSDDFTGFEDVRGIAISDENFAVIERLAHWQSAINMAEDHPWAGVGFGNYESAYDQYALPNWPIALGHAHNYYLNLLAETGIMGFSTYIAMWIVIIVITWQAFRRAKGIDRSLLLGLMGVWAHLTIHSLVDKLYVNNLFLHIGVMLGLLAVYHDADHENESQYT